MENKELLEKAKQANSPEELLVLAKENDVELTQEQAEAYFEQMNKSGELSDDELADAAGGKGGCGADSDSSEECPNCGGKLSHTSRPGVDIHSPEWGFISYCNKCGWKSE